jgi:hypothetical protein
VHSLLHAIDLWCSSNPSLLPDSLLARAAPAAYAELASELSSDYTVEVCQWWEEEVYYYHALKCDRTNPKEIRTEVYLSFVFLFRRYRVQTSAVLAAVTVFFLVVFPSQQRILHYQTRLQFAVRELNYSTSLCHYFSLLPWKMKEGLSE